MTQQNTQTSYYSLGISQPSETPNSYLLVEVLSPETHPKFARDYGYSVPLGHILSWSISPGRREVPIGNRRVAGAPEKRIPHEGPVPEHRVDKVVTRCAHFESYQDGIVRIDLPHGILKEFIVKIDSQNRDGLHAMRVRQYMGCPDWLPEDRKLVTDELLIFDAGIDEEE